MTDEGLSLRELADLLDVPPHVLSYWGREFSLLSPEMDEAGKAIYRRRDVEIAARIKELIYDERTTIAAAKKRLATEYQ